MKSNPSTISPRATASRGKALLTNHSSSSKKRRLVDSSDDDNCNEDHVSPSSSKTKGKKHAKKDKSGIQEEKRLRVFRKQAPQSYLDRLARVLSQRMFLIDRKRTMSHDGQHEEETFDIAGSTGNVYQVTISKCPDCTCPDAAKGNQCKHVIYVLVNILKAPEELAYQLAFLSTELTTIFASAPKTPQSSADRGSPGKRKPIEGDCPICVMEFKSGEETVWCKAACGNNIHRQCFDKWANSKPGRPKCVYCRTPWKENEDKLRKVSKTGEKNDEGYVNVANELGLDSERDESTYHYPRGRSNGYFHNVRSRLY